MIDRSRESAGGGIGFPAREAGETALADHHGCVGTLVINRCSQRLLAVFGSVLRRTDII